MANRIPMVCTDRAGRRSSAPSTPSRPSRPRKRALCESATSRVANTSPSRTSHGTQPIVGALDVESDFEDVAIDDLVILAFDAQPPDFLGLLPRAELAALVPVDDF